MKMQAHPVARYWAFWQTCIIDLILKDDKLLILEDQMLVDQSLATLLQDEFCILAIYGE
jgi:hypothetical protein